MRRHGTLAISEHERQIDGIARPGARAMRRSGRAVVASGRKDATQVTRPCESQAGLILLAALAAQAAEDPDEITARLLSAIGWVNSDGTELTELTAGHASWDTRIVLHAWPYRPGPPAGRCLSSNAVPTPPHQARTLASIAAASRGPRHEPESAYARVLALTCC